jgi:hypothetical protein
MRVVVDFVIDGSNCDVGTIRVVAVAVTDGSDLEPVITSESVGALKWALSNWLRNQTRAGVNRQRVMAKNDKRLEADYNTEDD